MNKELITMDDKVYHIVKTINSRTFANRDGSIVVAKGLSKEKRKEVIRHEKVHQKEISSGKLDYDEGFVYYGKKKYERNNGKIMHNGKAKVEGDHSLPWEKVAHKH